MYFHSGELSGDFIKILTENRSKFSTGVVHSFSGTINELKALLSLDLYFGVNGRSLQTEESCATVKQIPLERLMLETDCPNCEIKGSHASAKHVKTKFPYKKKE